MRKKDTAPIFEKAIAAACRAKDWLAMEVLSRSFNETDFAIWNLNAFAFIGVTEYWVDRLAEEKGLSEDEVYSLRRNLNLYEQGFASIEDKGNESPIQTLHDFANELRDSLFDERQGGCPALAENGARWRFSSHKISIEVAQVQALLAFAGLPQLQPVASNGKCEDCLHGHGVFSASHIPPRSS